MKIEGSFSDYVNVVSVVPQGSVVIPLLFVFYAADLFDVAENRLVNYADDSALFSIYNKPTDRDYVAQSISRDL